MSGVSIFNLTLLFAAAFLAGALNAVAGGGSFLTLPALIFTGVPSVAANATGTVALLPGYISGAWGFREDVAAAPSLSMRMVVILALIGGSLGAGLLLITPNHMFDKLVPWLLLIATAMFAFAPQLRSWTGASNNDAVAPWKAGLSMLIVVGYGGYFNGGLGILLLALFGLLGQSNLNAMNGLKNLVSALLTAIAVAIYALGDIVTWPQAVWMMLGATLGGYIGARLARQLPANILRWGIVTVGLIMAGIFFWQ